MASTSPDSSELKSRPTSTPGKEKATLRRHYRALRRQLSSNQQIANAAGVQHMLLRTLLLLRYQRIAAYLPADGELDTQPIIRKLWEYAKQPALPFLSTAYVFDTSQKMQMHFAPYGVNTPLVAGAYGLLEPASPRGTLRTRCPYDAQVLLMPLVAFDRTGTRLGMGGGFYDRYAQRHPTALRIGLAHSVQESTTPLPRERWDTPLDAVLSERETITFNKRASALLCNTPQTNARQETTLGY